LMEMISEATGREAAEFISASRIATGLLGDSIASNLFMLGYAWQKGLVPLTHESLIKAIELNGVAVAFNKQAFLWGRRAAEDLAAVEKLALPAEPPASHRPSQTLDELAERRRVFLTGYQDEDYARRYLDVVAAA